MKDNIINILGVDYKLYRVDRNDPAVQDGIDGRCDSYLKAIYFVNCHQRYKDTDMPKSSKYYYLHELEILKHEIIHAYLNEAGLKAQTHSCYSWTQNEEMIDWFALMIDRIYLTFLEVGEWLKQFYNQLR